MNIHNELNRTLHSSPADVHILHTSTAKQSRMTNRRNRHALSRSSKGAMLLKRLVLQSMKLLYVAPLFAFFFICANSYYADKMLSPLYRPAILFVSLAYLSSYTLFCHIYGGMKIGLSPSSELTISHFWTNLLSICCAYLVICLFAQHFVNPLPLLGLLLIQTLWSALFSGIANKLYFLLNPPKKTIMFYQDPLDLKKLDEIDLFHNLFSLEQLVKAPASFEDFKDYLLAYDAVLVCGIDEAVRRDILRFCADHEKECYFFPFVDDIAFSSAKHMNAFSIPYMSICSAPGLHAFGYRFIKRLIDIVVSLVGILITLPISLPVALLIWLDDRGPVFYTQKRSTRNHKAFNIIKFRSMRTDAEANGAVFAEENDPRITKIGKILRTFRLDELPQLLNILEGSMTLVGPRPERPEFIAQFENEMPDFSQRLQVKAGLTGYAQVYGRYSTTASDKLLMDLMYISNMSLAMDLKLLLLTLKVALMKSSSEGFSKKKKEMHTM